MYSASQGGKGGEEGGNLGMLIKWLPYFNLKRLELIIFLQGSKDC